MRSIKYSLEVATLVFALVLPSLSTTRETNNGPEQEYRDALVQRLLTKGYLLSQDFSPDEQAFYLAYASEAARLDRGGGLQRLFAEELFRLTRSLSPSWNRLALQKNAVIAMSGVDTDRALEMLRGSDPIHAMPDGGVPEDLRADACRDLFRALWRRKGIPSLATIRAEAARIGDTGEYPYPALNEIVRDLAKIDPEQAREIFLEAFTFFQRGSKVATADGDFVEFLLAFHTLLPSASTREALISTASAFSKRSASDTRDSYRVRVHTEKGIAEFDNATDELLLKLIPAVREVDPDLAVRILRDRPTVKNAAETGGAVKFAEGVLVKEGVDPNKATPLQERALEESRLANVKRLAAEKPEEALQIALTFTDSAFRATALGYVAAGFAQKDDERRARNVLEEAKSIRLRVSDPRARLSTLVAAAEAAVRLRDKTLLKQMTKAGFELGTEIYEESRDARPTQPAISTAGFRELRDLMRLLAKVDPFDAQVQLDGVDDQLLQAYLCLSAAQGISEADPRLFSRKH